jgi:hypothetical protein
MIFSAPCWIMSSSSSLFCPATIFSTGPEEGTPPLTFLRLLRSTLLDDQLIKLELLRGPLEDTLLDGILGDEPEHVDLLSLTDSVGSVHGLQVGLRVPSERSARSLAGGLFAHSPVRVEEHNNVGCDEVDTQTTRTSREEEDKLLAARSVVVVNGSDTVLVRRVTVNAAVLLRRHKRRPPTQRVSTHGARGTGSSLRGCQELGSSGRR